jgi:hypothetical protein
MPFGQLVTVICDREMSSRIAIHCGDGCLRLHSFSFNWAFRVKKGRRMRCANATSHILSRLRLPADAFVIGLPSMVRASQEPALCTSYR